MISNHVSNFTNNFHFLNNKIENNSIKDKDKDLLLKKSQIELMKLIHQQFQIPAIKKLYPNLEWSTRVLWVVFGNIYNQYETIGLDELKKSIEEYIHITRMNWSGWE